MNINLDTPSMRPYLVRAIYEWCADLHFTPYVAVQVDDTVRVPREHVRNGEIVLNISMNATSDLQLGNEAIAFSARFGGVARDISIPLNRVMAIYAIENGQGMSFPVLPPATSAGPTSTRPSVPHLAGKPDGANLQLVGADPTTAAPPSQARQTVDALFKAGAVESSELSEPSPEPPPESPPPGSRPTLTRVK